MLSESEELCAIPETGEVDSSQNVWTGHEGRLVPRTVTVLSQVKATGKLGRKTTKPNM